jgi:hypothetical protein
MRKAPNQRRFSAISRRERPGSQSKTSRYHANAWQDVDPKGEMVEVEEA